MDWSYITWSPVSKRSWRLSNDRRSRIPREPSVESRRTAWPVIKHWTTICSYPLQIIYAINKAPVSAVMQTCRRNVKCRCIELCGNIIWYPYTSVMFEICYPSNTNYIFSSDRNDCSGKYWRERWRAKEVVEAQDLLWERTTRHWWETVMWRPDRNGISSNPWQQAFREEMAQRDDNNPSVTGTTRMFWNIPEMKW